MRLGVDFGTTAVVVAAEDRGNYPVVRFERSFGRTADWFPPLIGVRGNERCYGWDAWDLRSQPDWVLARSPKRILGEAGPDTLVRIAEQTLPVRVLLRELTARFKADLLQRSLLPIRPIEPLQILLGVPANANTNQRFLTVQAFRDSGFEVLGLLDEPASASLEYTHRSRVSGTRRPGSALMVYDLGGGTFDAALVKLGAEAHVVFGTEGIATLGGDDFDDVLAQLVLQQAGINIEQERLTRSEQFRLREECRYSKEALHPNSRKIWLDLSRVREGWAPVSIPIEQYYGRCVPLVDQTLGAASDLLLRHGLSPPECSSDSVELWLEAVYMTGGGSELPFVWQSVRQRYGRLVRRSAQPRSATAIGLAIQANQVSGALLRQSFTRYFGVWREADHGRRIVFDPIFPKDTPLPGPGEGPLVIRRRYTPVHNVGHFRYLECSGIAEDRRPTGDVTFWDEIRFPFDPGLAALPSLDAVPVRLSDHARRQTIQETYICDAGGDLAVTIANLTAGYHRTFRLARWAGGRGPITLDRPLARGKSAANAAS